MPEFSSDQANNTDSEGKYLVLRKMDGGPKDTDYFIDLAIMASLPSKYRPEKISEVSRIVTIDSLWVEGDRYSNSIQAYVPKNTINVWEAYSGLHIAFIEEFTQDSQDTILTREGDEKYISEVNKANICSKIINWLQENSTK